jgi:hypothetical protein
MQGKDIPADVFMGAVRVRSAGPDAPLTGHT